MRSIQNSLVVLLTVAGLGLWIYNRPPFRCDQATPALWGLLWDAHALLVWVYTVVDYLQSRRFSPAAFLRQYGGGILFCLLRHLDDRSFRQTLLQDLER